MFRQIYAIIYYQNCKLGFYDCPKNRKERKMNVVVSFFHAHALWVLLCIATLSSFLWILRFKAKLKLTWYDSLILAVVHTLVGVAAVKVFAFLESIGEPVKGNMSLFGAVFALPLFYLAGSLIFKRKKEDVFDVLTLATVITLFMARINCFIGGCCLGIELANGSRVPTRELELLFYFILFNVLYVLISKGRLYGRAYPLFMLSYGAFRFVTEFFRESERIYLGAFHLAHLWALISLIIGLCFFIILTGKHRKSPKRKS